MFGCNEGNEFLDHAFDLPCVPISLSYSNYEICYMSSFIPYSCSTFGFLQIKLLDYRQSRLEDVPLKSNEIVGSTWSMDLLEFRKMKCKGVYDEKKSIYVGPRSRSISGVTENGYYVITPLIPVPGDPERYDFSLFLFLSFFFFLNLSFDTQKGVLNIVHPVICYLRTFLF